MKTIIHIITGLTDGGAEGVLYRLCKYDKTFRHVVISLIDEGKYGSLLEKEEVKVYCLNMKPGRVSISGLWGLFRLLRKYKPEVVQTWMYHADLIGGFIAKIAGIQSIFWNVRHTTLEDRISKRSTIWVAKACAFLSGWVPKKIIYCAYEAKSIHEKLGYMSGKSEIISNGYDLNQFKVSDHDRCIFRAEVGSFDQEVLIGMVGRYDPQKDHFNLIDALDLVNKAGYLFRLVLVGRDLDSDNQNLIDYIGKKQLSEKTILLSQRADIPKVMNGLDIHVLASSFGEGFPNVLAEAMACGAPCVATEVGDTALIIGNTGWVIPPKDPEALASAVIQAIDEKQINQPFWLSRKTACRDRIVENFSIDNMAFKYSQVWSIE